MNNDMRPGERAPLSINVPEIDEAVSLQIFERKIDNCANVL
jgi:hypothetical protein